MSAFTVQEKTRALVSVEAVRHHVINAYVAFDSQVGGIWLGLGLHLSDLDRNLFQMRTVCALDFDTF